MADDKKIDYVLDRLENVSEKVDEIGTSLAHHAAKFDSHVERTAEERQQIQRNTDILHNNTLSLQAHMKRTDILESYVKRIDERFTPVEIESARAEAVSNYVKGKVPFLAKLGGALTTLGGLGAGLKLLLQHFL